MNMIVSRYARNKTGMKKASSTVAEYSPRHHNVEGSSPECVTGTRGGFVEHKSDLSCTTKCKQNHICENMNLVTP